MSLALWYRFDGATTADLVNDSSGNGLNLTNTSVIKSPYTTGLESAAYFPSAAGMTLPVASLPTFMQSPTQPMTISFWFSRLSSWDQTLLKLGSSGNSSISLVLTNELGIELLTVNRKSSQDGVVPGGFTNFVFTYGRNDGQGIYGYINGASKAADNSKTLNLTPADMVIGGDFRGHIVDFRVYEGAMSSADVLDLYNGGLFTPFTTFTTTMYTHLADLEWSPSVSASFYRVTQIENGGSEETIESSTTELSLVVNGLLPSSAYTFNIYIDSDFTSPFLSKTDSTPVLSATSVTDIIARLSNDLSDLPSSALADFNPFLKDVLIDGQKIRVRRNDYIFVQNTGIARPRGFKVGVLTSFDPSGGSSQSVEIDVDGETESVTYDEVNDQVGVDGSVVETGEYFILGTYKVTVKDIVD